MEVDGNWFEWVLPSQMSVCVCVYIYTDVYIHTYGFKVARRSEQALAFSDFIKPSVLRNGFKEWLQGIG